MWVNCKKHALSGFNWKNTKIFTVLLHLQYLLKSVISCCNCYILAPDFFDCNIFSKCFVIGTTVMQTCWDGSEIIGRIQIQINTTDPDPESNPIKKGSSESYGKAITLVMEDCFLKVLYFLFEFHYRFVLRFLCLQVNYASSDPQHWARFMLSWLPPAWELV